MSMLEQELEAAALDADASAERMLNRGEESAAMVYRDRAARYRARAARVREELAALEKKTEDARQGGDERMESMCYSVKQALTRLAGPIASPGSRGPREEGEPCTCSPCSGGAEIHMGMDTTLGLDEPDRCTVCGATWDGTHWTASPGSETPVTKEPR